MLESKHLNKQTVSYQNICTMLSIFIWIIIPTNIVETIVSLQSAYKASASSFFLTLASLFIYVADTLLALVYVMK